MRAIVVGAGVVGLTTAVCLRQAGVAADVVAREKPQDTTSAVAAALWYPYRALPAARVTAWSAASYEALARLAGVAGSGVRMRAGTELLPAGASDPWWRDAVPGLRRTREGLRFVAPVVDMSVHLPWLVERLHALGGTLQRREIRALDELEADAVVNCAGLGARELARDASLTAVRGQVVRVSAPGVAEWLLDQSDPEQLVYVVPREHDVVLGGTAQEDAEDRTADPATTAAIRARCAALVPALRDAPVVDVAVGLRPVRPAVRLEAEGRVVHCYGHGGAGVTLAWGCAVEVAALLGARGERYAPPR
ncbi:MAG TPA: FAD-dependent oxidoreductase [Solirubrobacteraceae bacterium]|nr:FAD-dependent oxidoreductase [Solirubrobacteraceae bacterium]